MGDLLQFKRPEKEKNKLYVNENTGKITGSDTKENVDFGDRLARIRQSLTKINKLMAALKNM